MITFLQHIIDKRDTQLKCIVKMTLLCKFCIIKLMVIHGQLYLDVIPIHVRHPFLQNNKFTVLKMYIYIVDISYNKM